MLNGSHSLRRRAENRCPVCSGKFGLVRYYAWRTGLCSKRCRTRYRDRDGGLLARLGLLPNPQEKLAPVAALIPVRREGRDGRLVPARWTCD